MRFELYRKFMDWLEDKVLPKIRVEKVDTVWVEGKELSTIEDEDGRGLLRIINVEDFRTQEKVIEEEGLNSVKGFNVEAPPNAKGVNFYVDCTSIGTGDADFDVGFTLRHTERDNSGLRIRTEKFTEGFRGTCMIYPGIVKTEEMDELEDFAFVIPMPVFHSVRVALRPGGEIENRDVDIKVYADWVF